MNNDSIETTVLKENEREANSIIATILILSIIILIITSVLTLADVFDQPRFFWQPAMIFNGLILTGTFFLYKFYARDKKWIKIVMITVLILVCALLDTIYTASAALIMCIPVIVSIRYFDRHFTIYVAILSILVFMLSCIFGALYGLVDLNCIEYPLGTVIQMDKTTWLVDAVEGISFDSATYIIDCLLYGYLPKAMLYLIVATASISLSRQGKDLVLKQQKLSEKTSKLETELNMAASIQSSMLPNIFPAFPDRSEFEIYASMNPAKAVGGDFYDFFMIDEDHLCMTIADVSGKGVPAALFMMISKTIISNIANMNYSPAKILEVSNEAICANNENGMFVTVWLGILEISTGRLVSANAGHEYPAIMSPDGKFELYMEKHGFVLGGMEGMKYKEFEITLLPGSKIFVYTDGVPEANNINEELFGTDRMIDALNVMADSTPKVILEGVRCAVDEFVAGAEQFDDLTMVCLEYKGINNKE